MNAAQERALAALTDLADVIRELTEEEVRFANPDVVAQACRRHQDWLLGVKHMVSRAKKA